MRVLLHGWVILLAIGAGPAAGQTESKGEDSAGIRTALRESFGQPVSDELAAELNALIERLGAPSYSDREEATARLIKIGAPAFSFLRTTYRESDELEIRLRIERIVHEAYLNYHVFDRNGFLGISQEPNPVGHDEDHRIQEGHVGVKVRQIISGTGAEKAGLERGDVIIALDGEPIPETGLRVTAVFGEAIRVRRPGARVTLTVLRGTEQFDVEAILGARPRMYYGRGQGKVYEMLEEANRNFDEFWSEHFGSPPADEPGSPEP